MSEFADAFETAGLTWSIFRDFETALAEDEDLSDTEISRLFDDGIVQGHSS